jgi:iron complex transport system permease protein
MRAPDVVARGPAPQRRAALRHAALIGGGVAVLALAMAVGALVGPAGLGLRQTLAELAGVLPGVLPGVPDDSGLSEQERQILWQIRMPRVVLGAIVGGMLALAGAAYQGTLRNPLADPYLLGISSGAGLGATLAIVSGGTLGPAALPVVAFVGGLAAVAATYLLGTGVGGSTSTVTIVLAGVAVSAFAAAVQTFVQQRYDDTLRSVYSWLLGQLSTDGWSEIRIVLPFVVLSATVVLLHRRALDVIAVGDVEAASLGLSPATVRLVVIVAATLGTAAVVSVSGLIGFVGIVVPHVIRLVFGVGHRLLLPMSMLLGAAFLVGADVVARTALAPAEVPIGVVTAFVGAPFFLVVLRRSRGGVL